MIYQEIKNDVLLPRNGKIGSALETVGYYSDGEASDWMLYKAGVIAMSPELASASVSSMTFDIANPSTASPSAFVSLDSFNLFITEETIEFTFS